MNKTRSSFIYGVYEGYLVGCVCALIAGVIFLANMVGNLRHDVRAQDARDLFAGQEVEE